MSREKFATRSAAGNVRIQADQLKPWCRSFTQSSRGFIAPNTPFHLTLKTVGTDPNGALAIKNLLRHPVGEAHDMLPPIDRNIGLVNRTIEDVDHFGNLEKQPGAFFRPREGKFLQQSSPDSFQTRVNRFCHARKQNR